MTSFRFPPPPPPPPKPTPAPPLRNAQQSHAHPGPNNNRGGNEKGRGRGSGTQRPPGFHSSNGGTKGDYGQNNGKGHPRGRGGARRGHEHGRADNNRRYDSSTGQHSQYSPPSNTPPVKAYINPTFVNQPQAKAAVQPQVDPNALAQVMSFISTPAGAQSMVAFASHMTNTGNAVVSQSQVPSAQHTNATPQTSPPQHAGQKRKLKDRDNKSQPRSQQPSTKPPRAKAAVPPPVPSFGFSLPSAPVVRPVPSPARGKIDQKKRKLNLGLTRDDLPDESSEEEDIDEEATYAHKLKGGGFVFEHDGEQITIQTGAEVAAWIKDRKKKFPTQRRITEKAKEAAEKRHGELEFLRKLHGKPPKDQFDEGQKQSRTTSRTHAHNKIREEDSKRKQEELAALRKKLHESMQNKQTTSAAVDLGLGYDSETESDNESSVLSESSVVSSSEESSEESDSDANSDAGDVAPEAMSSKVGPPPIELPPPVRTRPQSRNKKEITCSNWQENGRCTFSNKCRYAHPPKEKQRTSLYDRMVEQELAKADQVALDAIKYLGQNGFLG